MAGLVHFSVFFRYMEEAEHALWRAAGLTIATVGEEFGFPRVAASFDFHAPLISRTSSRCGSAWPRSRSARSVTHAC